MSLFSKERVQKHLQNLAIQIEILKDFQNKPTSCFNDIKNTYTVYHAFLLAINNLMDIGGHILASLHNQNYSEYEEISSLLLKHKIISAELSEKMKGMAGFRNKLVHDYIEIEEKKVYQYLQKEVEVFIEYTKEIIKFIEKK